MIELPELRALQERVTELEEALKQVLMCSLGAIPDGIREAAKAVYMKQVPALRLADLERVVALSRQALATIDSGFHVPKAVRDELRQSLAALDAKETK